MPVPDTMKACVIGDPDELTLVEKPLPMPSRAEILIRVHALASTNVFTTDGGVTKYAVNHINTVIKVPDSMSDEEATLVVTAGTSMYGLTEPGGLVGLNDSSGDFKGTLEFAAANTHHNKLRDSLEPLEPQAGVLNKQTALS